MTGSYSSTAGLLAAVHRFAEGLGRGHEDKNASRCTQIMDRVMADVHPFYVYDIYADACPADGTREARGRRAGAVAGQLSRALGGVGGGDLPGNPAGRAEAAVWPCHVHRACLTKHRDASSRRSMHAHTQVSRVVTSTTCCL